MASKINPKGILKSNSRSKGPNPKGINPGGINNKSVSKPAPKPAVKPATTTTTPRTRGGVSKGNTPGTGNKYSNKTPINSNTSVSQGRGGVSKGNTPGTGVKYANKKPVTDTKPRTRAGVSKGETSGVTSKRKNLEALKTRANERLATEKSATSASKPRTRGGVSRGVTRDPLKNPKEILKKTLGKNTGRAGVTKGNQAAVKIAKTAKLVKAGKIGATILGAAAATYGIKKLYDYSKSKDDKSKKDTKKPEAGKKKEDTKPKVDDKPKSSKKDKWGRPESSKWYGFNPATKNYESPVTSNKKDERTGSLGKDIIKAGEKANASRKTKAEDNFKDLTPKKKETKPVVKKPVTTTPKADNKVDKMETKPIAPIATDLESKKEIVQPKAASTSTASTSPSTSSSTPSSSTPATSAQPRATFGNKIRGALNASRERRAERAEARGNEERADKLRDKIADSSKKMMMKKGGVVKSKSKKK